MHRTHIQHVLGLYLALWGSWLDFLSSPYRKKMYSLILQLRGWSISSLSYFGSLILYFMYVPGQSCCPTSSLTILLRLIMTSQLGFLDNIISWHCYYLKQHGLMARYLYLMVFNVFNTLLSSALLHQVLHISNSSMPTIPFSSYPLSFTFLALSYPSCLFFQI